MEQCEVWMNKWKAKEETGALESKIVVTIQQDKETILRIQKKNEAKDRELWIAKGLCFRV